VPLYEYAGIDSAGKTVSGVVEGTGRQAALRDLRGRGIFPTTLKEERRSLSPFPLGRLFSRRIPPLHLAATTRQLATLLEGGLPLAEALAAVGDEEESPLLCRALGKVRDEVIQGSSLHEALSAEGNLFPEIYVQMAKIGENSGNLHLAMGRLADFLEERARLKGRIMAAMAYPVLMTLVGSFVLLFLVAYVVPQVTRMLEDLGQALPWPTRLLIGFSDFLGSFWWLLLLALFLAGESFRRFRATEGGMTVLSRASLSFPLLGKLNVLSVTAFFSRTLGTLLQSGIPLLNALEITGGMAGNRIVREALTVTAGCVREGEGLAPPLKRAGIFPATLVQMTAAGEKSGNLDEMMLRVASTYEKQVDIFLEGLLSLLGPLLILGMGGVVGFIVIAILLPIFQASQGIG